LFFGGIIASILCLATACGFGIAGRHTRIGKVGLALSSILLLLILAFCWFIYGVLSSGMAGVRWGRLANPAPQAEFVTTTLAGRAERLI
jgi:hypothetical protein